ncbi:PAS domain-containing protein [Polyangium sp. 15x6]|uniref:PAS domain-containing protein n=1 Tax=Polyangium sp. 15x6 TaxID=3042687 RepID=UPI00249B81A8|nr:PAS domain-containing protein [Polyangium sp. 15x6]MDI3282008.1 PAS domain-containing protein [Polyangium sp. 15x6]
MTEDANKETAASVDALAWRARVEELEGRVVALEAELESARGALASGPRSAVEERGVNLNILQALVDHAPSPMYAKDLQGRLILVNQHCAHFFGMEKAQMLGIIDRDLFPPEFAKVIAASDATVLATGKSIEAEDTIQHPQGERVFLTLKFPIFHQGTIVAIGVTATDVTARRQLETQEAAVRDRIIAAQKQTIRELVTPLLPIERGVVAMPLVGAIEGERAEQILETLLAGVAMHAATIVILDITGVREIDEQVAQALVQAAQATRLLGAQVVLTGIKPAIAQTLVEMNADMTGIITRSTLRSGIAYALGTIARPGAIARVGK